MPTQNALTLRSDVFKGHVNKYAIYGLLISIASILFATAVVCLQMTGNISLIGLIGAQTSNPGIWALDVTPFMFAYWGQLFCQDLVSTAENILDETTRELQTTSAELKQKLQYQSMHDHLTNLPNYILLSERIEQAITNHKQPDELVLIAISIVDFKDIGVKYGGFNADILLTQFTEKLKSVLLQPYLLQAYMGMNMIARLKGATFAIFIPRMRKKDHHFDTIVANIVNSLSTELSMNGQDIFIHVRAGVAFYPGHAETAEKLIENALSSLWHAEKMKLSQMTFDPSLVDERKTEQIMLNEIAQAIEKDSFLITYQPQVELSTKMLIGADLIVDYQAGAQEIIGMDRLILFLEGSSMTHTWTHFILKKAIIQLAEWQKNKIGLCITVPVLDSTDASLPQYIANLWKEYGLSHGCLKLAMSEKACLVDQVRSLPVLEAFVALGIKLVIRDFCSGYSSFIYLSHLPIHEIKIKEWLIGNINHDDKKRKLLEAIIKVCETLDVTWIAEGVNDDGIYEQLKSIGCKYAQGSYLYPELTPAQLTEKLYLPR